MTRNRRAIRLRSLLPYPFLIVGGVVMFLPLYMMLATSFKTTVEFYADPFGLPRSLTLDNYANVWFQGQMNVFFKNSVIISLATVTLSVACATLAGYALARFRGGVGNLWRRAVFRGALVVPV